jgi:uncharacterized radical SAM superfamily Fe-S cluster-containing enzyme
MVNNNKHNVINQSICKYCNNVVPSTHQEDEGKMYLVKNCPQCGTSKFLVSTDAARYRYKREICGYNGNADSSCNLLCINCDHGKKPSLVFLDVTNRCNMNCPICLANIPAMGFRFDPPMEYFEKIFKKLSQIDPRPRIQLFGGEPTVREDLIDIINLAKSYGISARVVTNGIRLADEEYCKKLLATGSQLMFSFDGRNTDIYKKLRKHPKSYDLKIKALENVRKHRKAKVTIMSVVSYGVNDKYIGDLIEFCHDGKDYISALDFIPLKSHWGPEEIDADGSTMEDVERIVANAAPGVKFFPAGLLYKFHTLKDIFDVRITFGGAHPNCESVSAMISDGNKYQPLTKFLKNPQDEILLEAIKLDEKMGMKLKHSAIAKVFGKSGKKIILGVAILKFLKKNVNFQEVFGDRTKSKLLKIAWGLLRGERLKNLLRKYTKCRSLLRLMVLPFEDLENVESDRLVDCPTSFAYEHPITGEIRLMPVCAWVIYKNDILRKTANNYGIVSSSSKKETLYKKVV